ncbi:MAG: IPT/TIG domain-containing protein [Planctomycetaceae bacterium]
MRALLLVLLILAACSADTTLVVVQRLSPGGGGASVSARPDLDVVVRLAADATDFFPVDLMRLLFDGVDRTADVVMGGEYAVLRLSPAPAGAHAIELYRRRGPLLDTFTWNVAPFVGPRLDSVAPESAMVGSAVTLGGSGFGAGAIRVFFGGVEGTVTGSSDTTVTATVPAAAVPGLVYLLIGGEAAEGVVGFSPLDGAGAAIPRPTTRLLFAVFPAHGSREAPTRVYGINFDDEDLPRFSGENGSRLFDLRTESLGMAGDVLHAFAVVDPEAPLGPGTLALSDGSNHSPTLPFTVD